MDVNRLFHDWGELKLLLKVYYKIMKGFMAFVFRGQYISYICSRFNELILGLFANSRCIMSLTSSRSLSRIKRVWPRIPPLQPAKFSSSWHHAKLSIDHSDKRASEPTIPLSNFSLWNRICSHEHLTACLERVLHVFQPNLPVHAAPHVN
jgi:hypothetical protein